MGLVEFYFLKKLSVFVNLVELAAEATFRETWKPKYTPGT